jgi:hypothetical protein
MNPSASQTPANNHRKSSVLSFSSEYLPGSTFLLKVKTHRNSNICMILNSQGQNIGTIPGVQEDFVEEYKTSSVDAVLLSASKLSVHRFHTQEDKGYPSVFDSRFPRNDWSVLTVMFVKWDNSYAKRMALAYIHRDAWKEAEPSVKPFLLA